MADDDDYEWVPLPTNPNFVTRGRRRRVGANGSKTQTMTTTTTEGARQSEPASFLKPVNEGRTRPKRGKETDKGKEEEEEMQPVEIESPKRARPEVQSPRPPSQPALRPPSPAALRPPSPPAPAARAEMAGADDIRFALETALEPVYEFVRAIEQESGKRIFYGRRGQKVDAHLPIVPGSLRSEAEFRAKNTPILGTAVVSALLTLGARSAPNVSTIGATIDIATIVPLDDSHQELSLWFLNMLQSTTTLDHVIPSLVGQLELAAKELGNFRPVELIYSPDVKYRYAEYVARKYISPKSNVFADNISGGTSAYRISSGYQTSHKDNMTFLMGVKLWFKDAYRVPCGYDPSPVAEAARRGVWLAAKNRYDARAAELAAATGYVVETQRTQYIEAGYARELQDFEENYKKPLDAAEQAYKNPRKYDEIRHRKVY